MYQVRWTQDTTEGYTDAQLQALDAEYVRRLTAGEWASMDEADAAKAFADEVARRTPTPEETTRYTAIKTWENGQKDTQEFTDYAEMCRWLAADPEAGIGAIATDAEDGTETYVDPLQLADDVQAYL